MKGGFGDGFSAGGEGLETEGEIEDGVQGGTVEMKHPFISGR